jgi:gamma-glutamylcyclotransferase (GGCT)/AIG2-like uncharacterized protein YtfP
VINYFAYGTLQQGFPNWPEFADRLGDPVGRFRTSEPHGLVVPIEPGCGNPGCELLHRMAAMVPGIDGFQAEGDLFEIDRATLAAIDRLEDYDETRDPPGLFARTRVEVVGVDRDDRRLAIAYRAQDPARWRELAASGAAEILVLYDRHHAQAEPKPCCAANPGHAGPHDVRDPLATVR